MKAKLITWIFALVLLVHFSFAAGSVWTGAVAPTSANLCGSYADNVTLTASNVWNVENITLTSVDATLILPYSSALEFITSKDVSLGDLSALSKSGTDPQWTIRCNGSYTGTYVLYVNYSSSNNYTGSSIDQATSNMTLYGSFTTAPTVVSKSPSDTLTNPNVTLSITTNQDATCKYDTSDTDYSSMSNLMNGTLTDHSIDIELTDGSYTYYVRCSSSGYDMASSEVLLFTLDSTPPSILSYKPTGKVSSAITQLNITTSEDATCRYSASEDTSYSLMGSFDFSGTTSHSKELTGLTNGVLRYYVRCSDDSGNINPSDYEITFQFDAAPTAKITLDDISPVKPGTIKVTMTTSEDVQYMPSLSYVLDESQTSAKKINLDGEGSVWYGFMNIDTVDTYELGMFIYSGTDISGSTGTTITEGGVFILDGKKPPQPTGLVLSTSPRGIDVNWRYDGESATFVVYRSTSSTVTYTDFYAEASDLDYTDSDVKKGVKYYYRVSAIDDSGNEGLLSDSLSIIASDTITTNAQPDAVNTTSDDNETATDEEPEKTTPAPVVPQTKLNSSLLPRVDDAKSYVQDFLSKIDKEQKRLLKQNKDLATELNIESEMQQQKLSLRNILLEVGKLRSKDLTKEELDSQLDTIYTNSDNAYNLIPTNFMVLSEKPFEFSLDITDIQNSILEILKINRLDTIEDERKDDYIKDNQKSQKNFIVNSSAKKIRIEYSNTTKEVVLITKVITALKPSKNMVIVETIPKTIVSSASEIDFITNNYKVLVKDPVIKWDFGDANTSTIKYIINKDLDLDSASETKTVILENARKILNEGDDEDENDDGSASSGVFGSITGFAGNVVGPISFGKVSVTLFILVVVGLLAFFLTRSNKNLSLRLLILYNIYIRPIFDKTKSKVNRKSVSRNTHKAKIALSNSINKLSNLVSISNVGSAKPQDHEAFHYEHTANNEYSTSGLVPLNNTRIYTLLAKAHEMIDGMNFDMANKAHFLLSSYYNSLPNISDTHRQRIDKAIRELYLKLELYTRINQVHMCAKNDDNVNMRYLLNDVAERYNDITYYNLPKDTELMQHVKQWHDYYSKTLINHDNVKYVR